MIEDKLDQIIELLKQQQANSNHVVPPKPEEDDDLAGGEPEEETKAITLADVQDAVRRAAGVNKEKTKKVLAKYKAERAGQLDAKHYEAAIADLDKIK